MLGCDILLRVGASPSSSRAASPPDSPTKMTDSRVPEPSFVCPAETADPAVANGQCEQEEEQQQQPGTESQVAAVKMNQEMKITDSLDDGGWSQMLHAK